MSIALAEALPARAASAVASRNALMTHPSATTRTTQSTLAALAAAAALPAALPAVLPVEALVAPTPALDGV